VTPHERPRVLINMAVGLDGKTSPVASQRMGPHVLSRGAEDPKRMRRLRARADAIVIGASNLRDDDPDLALDAGERRERQANRVAEPLRVVVTTRGGGLSSRQRFFRPELGGASIVAHAEALPPALQAELAAMATLVPFGPPRVQIRELLGELRRRGARTVLCEGGAELNAHFFEARAVDELFLTLIPRIFGGRDAPGVVGGGGFPNGAVPDARLLSSERVGDELFLHYAFDYADQRPEPAATSR
jgi:riboflavin-specific deaminase-like protein